MTAREIHNSGLPLAEALEKFGNWRKFHSEPYALPHETSEKIENQQQAVEALPQQISNLAHIFVERGRRRRDVADEFIRRLRAGKLVAAGYISPRSVDDQPTSIPTDLWDLAKLNFENSEIQSGSLMFENVRIARPAKHSKPIEGVKLRLVHSTEFAAPRKIGRPGSREKIFAAYQTLKSAGQIDFSKPMTHAYPSIRNALIQQFGITRGFQNEAMRLAIKDDFQATAAARGPSQKL